MHARQTTEKIWNIGILIYALIAIAIFLFLVGGGFLYGLSANDDDSNDTFDDSSRIKQRNVLYLISGSSIACAVFIFVMIIVS